ncbi:MAG: DNA ligase D [Bryobacteraceae bacterium]|nr:DNA ligase D [Bryobacteraceae bacterium]
MALEDYRKKRTFDKTPEPAGGPSTSAGAGPVFVVQKHAARRLHYDFRLEIDGVLKSWAVPKGPSLNPADKRLAVQTEDHPLEYGNFEGEIPKGNYGAGTVVLWDRGAFEVEGDLPASRQLERGDMKIHLTGHKLRGSFALVRLKSGKDWLLIKHRDSYVDPSWDIDAHDGSVAGILPADPSVLDGAREAPMPDRVEVMLAVLGKEAFSDPDWLFELKWDGMRAIAIIDGGALELRSRTWRNVTAGFPELAILPERLQARRAVLDGEIVVLDSEGRSNFERMQSRMNVARPTAALLKDAPVDYYIFDILYCDGYDLRSARLVDRKRFLRSILDPQPPVRYSDHIAGQGEELFKAASRSGAEGILAKRADSPYAGGRSPHWMKLKILKDLDAVIGGFTAPRGGRQYFGALLLGLYRDGKLEFIGGVGTGFTGKRQAEIMKRLEPLETARWPFSAKPDTREPARWVAPKLAARVTYGEMTAENRLRQPVFVALRDDLKPEDCVFAAEVTPAPAPSPPERRRPSSPPADLEQELLRGRAETAQFDIDGKPLRLSNLNKVYFPETGFTKRQLLAYYYRVAPYLLPFLKDRPLVLQRHPNGVTSQGFYQKDAGLEKPDWIDTVRIDSEGSGKQIEYYVANDLASLLFLTNLGCIEHNPWSSRADNLERPDYVFFDLDPTGDTPYATVVKLARAVMKVMDRIGCTVFLKTSGASGMHIYLPLEPVYTYEHVRTFAEIIARLIEAQAPDLLTFERATSKRKEGRIYFDFSQNAYGRPLASVYSVRPVAAATVSAPISPAELKPSLTPKRFTLSNLPARLEKTGDLWTAFWNHRQRIEPAIERLHAGIGDE